MRDLHRLLSKPAKPCRVCRSILKRSKSTGRLSCNNCKNTYYKNNKEKVLAQIKLYRRNNKEILSKRDKDYRHKNKEIIKIKQKIYQEKEHPDYKIWVNIGQRCNNTNDEHYPNYGGRGIIRCGRWDSFKNFIEDMGSRPEPRRLYSIERIDVNGNYEPSNCIWATAKEQQNNKRSNRSYRTNISGSNPIEYEGKIYTLDEFANLLKIPSIVVKYRYSQHSFAEWIIESDTDLRFFEYKNHKYNLVELSLISGIYYNKLYSRLLRDKWSVEKAMSRK